MNRFLEIAVVAVIVVFALTFVVVRLIKMIRGKGASCCSSGVKGSGKNTRSSCPHCSGCTGKS